MKSCAGPGKTALLAWLGWNFLLTRPHPMVGATSVNAANLRANLWTELARWYAAPRAGILRAALHHDEDRNLRQGSSSDLAARSAHLGAGRQCRADRQRSRGLAREIRHVALGRIRSLPRVDHAGVRGDLRRRSDRGAHRSGRQSDAPHWAALCGMHQGASLLARHRDHRRPRRSKAHDPRLDRARSPADRDLRPGQPVGQGARVRRVPAVLAQRAHRPRRSFGGDEAMLSPE